MNKEMRFWAKTTKDDKSGKSVLSHMEDVRAVAGALLTNHKALLKSHELNTKTLSAFAGLHDIGKISPGFQSKCLEWLRKNNLEQDARNYAWDKTHETDHAKVTQYTIQQMLQQQGMKTEPAELWAALAGAHHGRLKKLGIKPNGCQAHDEWEKSREETANTLVDGVLPDGPIDDSWPLSWWLAGLITVADWIGSNEDWFPAGRETIREESSNGAIQAIKTIGFEMPDIRQGLTFTELFPTYSPNDLQSKTVESIAGPGLYIIEAPMGMGKTEAALWSAYRLICEKKASGIYFALPTQTTSNRIHYRMQAFLDKVVVGHARSHLVHSGSWLLENCRMPSLRPSTASEEETTRDAIDWFASKKRGLLAPFGVGTIDQALMAVIAVKHFFVRQFALAGKVIILDEVHSYDLYTGTLIKKLCDCLLPLGCTILILSATLTREGKRRFAKLADAKRLEEYPLISGSTANGKKTVFEVIEPPRPKQVTVKYKTVMDALVEARKRAEQGACVLWVCDTVNCAQEMYEKARSPKGTVIELGLLHSRFPVFKRQKIEDKWLSKLGKDAKDRGGCILFSTQIVEQSVDLDADFMVSELAPTDMLLQRMGRLWRHERKDRPVSSPEFWVLAEDLPLSEFRSASIKSIKKMLGAKANVYAPYVLLRSLAIWSSVQTTNVPGNIRGLLEQTYDPLDNEPESWQRLFCEMAGEADALRQFALNETNLWQPLAEDEEGKAKTRASSYPTVQLILAVSKNGNSRTLCNGKIIELKKENAFSIYTARALHENIVKVPSYLFRGFPERTRNQTIAAHVRGTWQIGYVKPDNTIECKHLNSNFILRYTDEKGVEIMKSSSTSEVEDEPCD